MPYSNRYITIHFSAWDDVLISELSVKVGALSIRKKLPQIRYAQFEIEEDRCLLVLQELLQEALVVDANLSIMGGDLNFYKIESENLQVDSTLSWAAGYLQRLNVLAAWEHTRGEALFPIAVIDSGVNTSIVEFASKTVTGWNSKHDTSDFSPGGSPGWHGTATSSIACGDGGRDDGVFGVAPGATLVHIKMMDDNATDQSIDCATGILKAHEMGARVISVSTGYTVEDLSLKAAIDYVTAAGCLCVFSAGNTGNSNPYYPAIYDNVVTCGGTMRSDRIATLHIHFGTAPGSSFGPHVDIVSHYCALIPMPPGYNSSTLPPYYNYWNKAIGTSFSAPAVAGVAHLIWSINPLLTNLEVREILLSTVDKPLCEDWAFTYYFSKEISPGVGYPDAEKAVLKAKSTISGNSGIVFPFMRLHGPLVTPEDWMCLTSWPPSRAFSDHSDGLVEVTTCGEVGFELTGFCNGQEATSVELWVNGECLYSGVPTSPWSDNLFYYTPIGKTWEVKVIAHYEEPA